MQNINSPQTCPQASYGFGCSINGHSTGGACTPHRQHQCLWAGVGSNQPCEMLRKWGCGAVQRRAGRGACSMPRRQGHVLVLVGIVDGSLDVDDDGVAACSGASMAAAQG
jgi:hypothetical protein